MDKRWSGKFSNTIRKGTTHFNRKPMENTTKIGDMNGGGLDETATLNRWAYSKLMINEEDEVFWMIVLKPTLLDQIG